MLSSTTAIFHIGSRQGDEIRDLIGDAFLGWLVSDGYAAYRSFKKRQRCLAHLIRKGVALAGGLNPVDVVRNPGMVSFVIDIGDSAVLQIGSIIWIVRDSRRTSKDSGRIGKHRTHR